MGDRNEHIGAISRYGTGCNLRDQVGEPTGKAAPGHITGEVSGRRHRGGPSTEKMVSKFAPNLVRVLGKSSTWVKFDKKIARRFVAAQGEIEAQGVFTCEPTLFELACIAEHGFGEGDVRKVWARSFLAYVDGLVCEVEQLLSSTTLPTLRVEMNSLFLGFGQHEAQFREKLGELAAIVYLGRKLGVAPSAFEVQLAGRQSHIDLLQPTPAGGALPIELMSVFVEDDRVEGPADLNEFLDARVRNKFREKLSDPAWELGSACPFSLIIIIWFERVETWARFATVLTARADQPGRELGILMLQQFRSLDGTPAFVFASVHEHVCLVGTTDGVPQVETDSGRDKKE